MAYLDTSRLRARPGPIAAVIAIHAGIGYLLVTGLGAEIIRDIVKPNPKVINVPIEQPPEPDPVPDPRTNDLIKPQVPRPSLDLASDTHVDVEPFELPPIDNFIPDSRPDITAGGKVEPIQHFDPVAPKPRTHPSSWATTGDYPSIALRRGLEGTARFRLEIASNGKVESCTIVRSSGVDQLDQATCRNVMRRAKFVPARDASDRPVRGSYESSIRWRIPD